MSDSLIAQVRKCAEAQKKADLSAGKAAHDLTEADAAARRSWNYRRHTRAKAR